MSAKRQRRKAADIAVPDISEDAAERKRVLNVLAQRRYRKKKREHLAALESRLEKETNAAPTDRSHREEENETLGLLNQPAPSFDIPDTAEVSQQDGSVLGSMPPVSPGTMRRFQEAVLDPYMLPNSEQDGLDISDVPDLMSGFGSNSTTSTSSNVPSTPELLESLFLLPPTSAPESTGMTQQLLENPANQEYIHNQAFSDALQSRQTSTFTFPDDHTLEVPTLAFLRAVLTVASRMNLAETLWDLEKVSPFYKGPVGLNNPSSSWTSFTGMTFPTSSPSSPFPIPLEDLPPHLRPTPTQLLIPHHSLFDLLPWPSVRDKLIQVFSMPPHLRPGAASDPMGPIHFVYDLEDQSEGMRVNGADPFNADMWEVGQLVFERWWWAFDKKVIEGSNRLRRGRGQQGLVLGTVE